MIIQQTSPSETDDADATFRPAYIAAIAMTAALGGLMFGYDWVVIGGAELFYEKYFHLSGAGEIGWAMSCALIGALAGTIVSGSLSDRFGRKPLLLLSGLLFIVTSIGTGLANDFQFFVANRLLGGVAIGIASNLSPLYIAEIAPAGIRGRLVAMNQLTIALGVMLAQVVNWIIARPAPAGTGVEAIPFDSWNVQSGWRWMFAVTAVPAAVFFGAMFAVPESPRWLASKGRDALSESVLARIGGASYAARTLSRIKATLHEGEAISFRELLAPGMPRILLLGILLAVFQQWCGINVIYQYGARIFAEAGFNVSGILFSIVVTGVVGLLMTLVAVASVDRWGRRNLMVSGSLGLAVIYAVTGWVYHHKIGGPLPVILVVAAIACYCYSLAPVTWVILSEIFPNRIRGAAMAVSVVALWLANFLLSQSFPIMFEKLGMSGCFWVYSVICLGGTIYIHRNLTETKGKTLEQIENDLIA